MPKTLMIKDPAKWKPINLKRFIGGIKKLQKEVGIKRLKEIEEKAIQDERYKHAIIINYILNKNSHSIQDGGADNEGLWRDLEEYENYLNE
jgi:hypothetical protein